MDLQILYHNEPEEPPSAVRSSLRSVFPADDPSLDFRRRFFPAASLDNWNDWRWQLRNRITKLSRLEKIISLTDQERQALLFNGTGLPLAITPYYASLISPDNPQDPLRRTMVPVAGELIMSAGESRDPLGEESHSPVPGLVHRYPDRVLFLATGCCSSYCRYCTRSRLVGGEREKPQGPAQWKKGLAYIEATPAIRDVLLSGGDPLTMPDEKLEWLLDRLRRIPHVEMVRIGTKAPIVLPQRITPTLVAMLRRYHPLWMSIHCTHPAELTAEAARAFNMLADAGIPLGSQTVLLAGINDSVETMKQLVHGLVRLRVKPYYLYQCDPIAGSAHFRTSVARGLEIYQGLRGHTTGYAVPNYVIDAPGGGGKIPLIPENIVGRDGSDLLLRNYEGKVYRYPDVIGAAALS